MKRKSPRGIPDFSPKRAGFKQQNKSDLVNASIPVPPPPPPPKMKPQQTASKSGNRGK